MLQSSTSFHGYLTLHCHGFQLDHFPFSLSANSSSLVPARGEEVQEPDFIGGEPLLLCLGRKYFRPSDVGIDCAEL